MVFFSLKVVKTYYQKGAPSLNLLNIYKILDGRGMFVQMIKTFSPRRAELGIEGDSGADLLSPSPIQFG